MEMDMGRQLRYFVSGEPYLYGFIFTCIPIDCLGLLPREGGGAGAGPFDLMQYCYNPGFLGIAGLLLYTSINWTIFGEFLCFN
jgi:hypothetical protein